jgi:hypothetical protein
MGPTITAGQDGSFQQEVSVPDGEAAGTHNICATAQVSPVCAQFTVLAGVPATPTPTAVPTPTPTPVPTPAATATAAPVAISGRPQGSKSALSTLFPWILIPVLALLLIGATALYMIVRGRSQAKPPRPQPGTGVPIVTHLSPKSGGAAPTDPEPPVDDHSTLPPPEAYPPQVPTLEAPPPIEPEPPVALPPREPAPPAALPGPRPQLPGAGIDPPRAAGGDDDVDRPEPSD